MKRWVVVGAFVAGCTPRAEELPAKNEEAPSSDAPQPPDAPPKVVEPPAAAPEPEVVVDPAPQAPTVDPAELKLEIALREDGSHCRLKIEDSGFPAYDPVSKTIITLDRMTDSFKEHSDLGVGKFSLSFVGEDGSAKDEFVLFEPTHDSSCKATHRSTQKRLRALKKRLAQTRWEPMPVLPLGWIGVPETTLPYRREAGERGPDGVEAFYRKGEVIVRIAGVKVLERDTTLAAGNEVDRFYGHRPTGVVLVTSVECFGEDAACEPGSTWTTTRWTPETLAEIDRHPCTDCETGSALHPTGADAAWRM